MSDPHAIARTRTESGIPPAQADAITAAVAAAAEQDVGGVATQTDITAVRADMASLEARIYRAMLIQAGVIIGAIVGILRVLE